MLILNTGFGMDDDRDAMERLVGDGLVDAVAVGRPFLANPDTFYGGGAEGCTDYPTLR